MSENLIDTFIEKLDEASPKYFQYLRIGTEKLGIVREDPRNNMDSIEGFIERHKEELSVINSGGSSMEKLISNGFSPENLGKENWEMYGKLGYDLLIIELND